MRPLIRQSCVKFLYDSETKTYHIGQTKKPFCHYCNGPNKDGKYTYQTYQKQTVKNDKIIDETILSSCPTKMTNNSLCKEYKHIGITY